MLRGIENLYYRDPRLLALTVAVIVVGGLSSYAVLPRAEDPTLVERYAGITTFFPGASAERVEALVTEKIEDELRQIEEIKILKSSSRLGISFVSVELHDSVDNVDPVWSRVQNKLAQAEAVLPHDATKPNLERLTVTAYTLLVALAWERDAEPQYAILRRVAEELEDRLRTLPGTDDVDLFGDPQEEYRVEVAAAELAPLGLTATDVASALARGDAKAPAGQLRHRENDLLIEVAGELTSLDRVLEVPVRVQPDGRVVRVGDIARVAKTVADPPSELALVHGQPAIVVAIRMNNDQRVDTWAAAARAEIDHFANTLPTGLRLDTIFDQSGYVEDRLDGLAANLILAMGLVVLVILFMMGWRSAIAVGVALPLATLMVLTGLRLLGVPLQQMSVTGLIVALGLLIDNAIVIVDEVRRRTARGDTAPDAIAQAVRHLAIPLFGSTFTTALAFMPLVLMPGGAGEFVGSIGISVILAIASSLFLSLTVIPAVAGRIDHALPPTNPAQRGFFAAGVNSPTLTETFRTVLDFLFRRPWLGIAVAVILPIIGFWQAARLEEQFFPPAERNQFAIELRLPAHAALAQTQRLTDRARHTLAEDPAVEASHWFLGRSAPKFYYNMMETQEDSSYFAGALVQIRSRKNVARTIRRLQRALDDALPSAQIIVRQLEQGPPFDAPVEIRVFGPDLDELHRIGDKLRARLAALPDVTHTRNTLLDAAPKLWLALDEEKARSVGLHNSDIAAQIRANVAGITGGSVLEGTEELPVRVRLAPEQRSDVASLASLDLRLATPPGAPARYLPVNAIGSVTLQPERAAIPRYQGIRVNTVQAFTLAGALPAKTLHALQENLEQTNFTLPPGYRLEVGGEAEQRDTAVGNLLASVSILATIMAASLVLTFSSFRIATLIGLVATLSLGLGLFPLWFWGYPFGFMAIVGTMGLVGVAVNDSIVVLAAIREDQAARAGEPAAVRDVVIQASRHVFSTTITTIAGFTPLLIAGGGFWPPLAIAIAGGVAGATMLALVLVPSGYRLLMCPKLPNAAPQTHTASLALDT